MKKILALLLISSISIISLYSCQNDEVVAPTCDEVIAAYEAAGYKVSHVDQNEYKDESTDENCYIKVWLDDEYTCMYFYFYDSAEVAEAMDEQREFHILLYLFTIIYGDPTWVWSETYGNIQYEYEDPRMTKPFKELIK